MPFLVIDAAQILVSIGCNLVASFVFLFIVLWFLRPRFEISPLISKVTENDDAGNPRTAYIFKVINKSKFDAFDLQVSLNQKVKYPVGGGNMNVRMKPILLRQESLSHIVKHKKDKNCAPYALHAWLFRTYENVEEVLQDEHRSIEIIVTARHGLTGLSDCFKKDYDNTDILKTTRFKFGNSIEVV